MDADMKVNFQPRPPLMISGIPSGIARQARPNNRHN
jgi:hypothetical protein